METVNKVVSSLETAMAIISSNQVTGEAATSCKTDTFTFNVQKKLPRELSYMKIGGVFELPNVRDIFHNTTVDENVDVQVSSLSIKKKSAKNL